MDNHNRTASVGKRKYLTLRERVKRFALDVIGLYEELPRNSTAQVIGRQLLRSGTSVGAQYCEGHRGKSGPDFVSKLEGAMQELEESAYWLELLAEAKTVERGRLHPLIKEADELMAIFVTIVRSVKAKRL
jgi:four helix bundle protein